MTGTDKKLLRAAAHIHQWIVCDRQELPAIALSGLPWQRLQTLARQIGEAQRRGFLRAGERLLANISTAAERLHLEFSCLATEWRSWAERPKPASAAEVFRDLLALRDEFEDVRWDLGQRNLSVCTSRIVLDDIDLGRFEICLEWNGRNYEPEYRVIALDANPCRANETVTHPHVSNERLCEGEGHSAIRAALEQGRLYDFFVLVVRVLNTYSRGNAYAELDEWDGTRCSDCDSFVGSADECACYKCDAVVCSECRTYCSQCDDGLCSSCITSCARCHQSCCPSCLARCSRCGQSVCGDCRDDDLCTVCHELGEPDHETGDSIEEAGQTVSQPAGSTV